MIVRPVQFLALLFTALAMIPGGAHLFALPNKIDLGQDQYFLVQGIYRGWALFGVVLFGALIFDLARAVTLRGRPAPFALAVGAVIAIAATLVIFFTWTYPTNVATENWTVSPENWRELRSQWEYSYAVNALITLIAFCCVAAATLLPGWRAADDALGRRRPGAANRL